MLKEIENIEAHIKAFEEGVITDVDAFKARLRELWDEAKAAIPQPNTPAGSNTATVTGDTVATKTEAHSGSGTPSSKG